MSLALLALLAAAEGRGFAREQLLAYLWPESNMQRARNSLNQTLYAIRQQLGEDVVIGTTTLRLNPERVTCDLWEYREALKRGDLAAAVRLREGELLETFTLPGLPEFEQWLVSERARDTRAFRDALERAAQSAARNSDQRSATAYWKWLAVEEPLSARVAHECMQALAASGDLPGALAHAQAYTDRVRAELGTQPAAEVLLLATQLRSRLAAAEVAGPVTAPVRAEVAAGVQSGGPPTATPATDGTVALVSGVPTERADHGVPTSVAMDDVGPGCGADVPVPRLEATDAATEHGRPDEDTAGLHSSTDSAHGRKTNAPARRPGARVLALGGSVLALVALALWWITRTPGGPFGVAAASGAETQSILIFPFEVHGGPDAQHLSAALPSLLVSGLDGAGALRAAEAGDPAGSPPPTDESRADEIEADAARRGIDHFITGEIVVSGERLRVRTSLQRRAQAEPLAVTTVEGVSSELFDIADRIALELLQRWQGAGKSGSPRPSAVTTASLPALRAYLMGEAALRADQYLEAIEAFREAVSLDSTFALAYYRLSVSADLAARHSLARDAADRAIRYAAELPERERLLVAALQALRTGNVDEAEALYRRLAAEYPADPEGWFGLGEVLFHHGPLRGQSVTAARASYERVLQLDPADAESLIHLARIAALEGRTAEADALVRRAREIVPDSDAVEIRAVRAFALGDRPGLKYVTRQLLAHPRHVPAATAIQVAVYQDDLTGAETFATALLDPAEARITRSFAHRLLAQTALARGQVRRAERELAAAASIDATPTLELRSLYVTFPLFAFPRSTVHEVLNALATWEAAEPPADSLHNAAHAGLHQHIRLHRLGVLRLALGDTAGAAEAAAALERMTGDERSVRYARTLAWSVRARRAAAAGQAEVALAMLDRAEWTLAAEVFVAEVADRFLRAELLEQVGRPEEALRWYESIAQRATYELVYFAPAMLRQAVIHDHLGHPAEALQRYRRFVELWRDCDPELRPLVSEAARRIAELERPE